MGRCFHGLPARLSLLPLILGVGGCLPGDGLWRMVISEQRHLEIREPSQLPPVAIPPLPPPETVTHPAPEVTPRELSLDEAIRIALANSKVVRVLGGVTAVSSGQTIYDPAITNTSIDVERAVFDPVLNARNNFNRIEQPVAVPDPFDPMGALIGRSR